MDSSWKLIFIFYSGLHNTLEYSYPHDQTLSDALQQTFTETEFPEYNVPVIEQLEFIWSAYHSIFVKNYGTVKPGNLCFSLLSPRYGGNFYDFSLTQQAKIWCKRVDYKTETPEKEILY